MFRCHRIAIASLLAAGLVWAAEGLREEFHQSYPLAATGRVSLHNVNGSVRISAWEKNEVKVDAVKRARSAEALKEAEIVVEARADAIEIRTRYPEHSHRDHDSASVDYTLTVPRGARLDEIKTVNGSVEIEGTSGEVRAASVNGAVRGLRLVGEVGMSTVNGRVEVEFERLEGKRISLRSVNGTLVVRLPQGAGMHLNAATVHGEIESDFDLPVRRIRFGPGRDLDTVVGGGGVDLSLRTVNGSIRLQKR
jgi:DUF4097 and DUF4098 domain-containing protein YvlB